MVSGSALLLEAQSFVPNSPSVILLTAAPCFAWQAALTGRSLAIRATLSPSALTSRADGPRAFRAVDLLQTKEFICRAWDSSMNTQPMNFTWNLMGMMNNYAYKVKVGIRRSRTKASVRAEQSSACFQQGPVCLHRKYATETPSRAGACVGM